MKPYANLVKRQDLHLWAQRHLGQTKVVETIKYSKRQMKRTIHAVISPKARLCECMC